MPNLSDFISIAPRYARAVNLERDTFSEGSVAGYVVTATAEHFLSRFGRTLAGANGHGAWTLTGPYGAGKSSFAVFLANLFSPLEFGAAKEARGLLKEQCPETYSTLFDGRNRKSLGKEGYLAVVVSGAAEPLLQALVRCAIRDIGAHFRSRQGRRPDALYELDALGERLSGDEELSTSSVVNVLTKLSDYLIASGRGRGIILIVDELGKFLEYAARTDTLNEVFVLQQIAEATNQSSSTGLYLVTILHQSFDRYASELRPKDREEWAKVQGRFEDIAFQEPPEQLLELISRAIIKPASAQPLRPLIQRAGDLGREAERLGLVPRGMSDRAFVRCMERSAPLHPLTALALVRLCRKFGQNQRSLFSFMTSPESHGLSAFLRRKLEPVEFYGLAELYDFLAEGFGSGLALGDSAARWSEIQNALDKANGLKEDEVALLKVIGILSAIGQADALKASPDVIQFALGLDQVEFRRCKLRLLEDSLIVERKHSGTLALWEGSDLDLDTEVRDAGRHVASNASLADKLNLLWTPRPMVAKKHSFRTGTLRYFTIRFADAGSLSKSLSLDPAADGLLLYCLPASRSERAQLTALASETKLQEKPEVLVAIPEQVVALEDAVNELDALRWVQTNKRELESDGIARRELRGRISAAENRISNEVQRLFAPEEETARRTDWFHHGLRQPIPTSRTLATFLSDICDRVYSATPVLRNELVNRRSLSPAAAAARRNVLEAMLSKHKEKTLGFEGTPPEVSVYSSILGATGIHSAVDGEWGFREPETDSALKAVWNEILTFFGACDIARQKVSVIFEKLQGRPYGLKMGVIPIIFCAAAVAHETEIAFYENGAFLPELTVEAYERLVKTPGSFELRRYRIEGVRRDVYFEMARLFGREISERSESLLTVVKPLFRFLRRLPEYCQKTQRLRPETIAVRSALLHAKEPDQLLFSELPRACGLEPFEANESSGDRAQVFFVALRKCILELQGAFDNLLSDAQEIILRNFDAQTRTDLVGRAEAIVKYCVEPKLKAAVKHMANQFMEDALWTESIATTLVGKAPKSWTDEDRVRFEIAMAEASRNVRHLEAILYDEQKRSATGNTAQELFRIGVADRHSMELGAVVAVEAKDKALFTEAVLRLQSELSSLGLPDSLALAALAFVSKGLLVEVVGSESLQKEVVHG